MVALFLSHSSQDNDITKEVHTWLVQQGYGPAFVDFAEEDGLVGGKQWWEQLSENLKRARVFLALVSEHWLRSKACQEELTIARHERKHIIALLIDKCNPGGFLNELQNIDFQRQQPEAWQRLARALEEAGASPMLFRPDPSRPPFPGLLAFNVEDAAYYFGREAEIAAVLARLARVRRSPTRLFVIAGPSGSGKSSLLQAGLLARLRRRSAEWLPLMPLRPSLGWKQGVVEPLEKTCVDWYAAPEAGSALPQLLALEAEPAKRSAEFFRQLAGSPDAIPVLSIDQGEELLAIDGRDSLRPIVKLLGRLLASDSPILGIIAIRSDMLGALQQHPVIGPLIIDDIYALPPMPRERYALLIDGPMAQYSRHVRSGSAIDPALRDALISSANGADALPLVAFTLGNLWDEHGRRGRQLTLDQLDQLGGVDGAVAAVAERVISTEVRAPDGCDLDALRRAFVPGLAGVAVTGDIVRRRAAADSIPPRARRLVDEFVKKRLLVQDAGPAGQAVLEIAHEALLRQWPRLREWMSQDLEALHRLEDLARWAAAWHQSREDKELLAHRGDLLAKAVSIIETDLFERRFPDPERETVKRYAKACQALERENKARSLTSAITLAAAFFEKAQRESDHARFLQAAALLGAALDTNPYVGAADEVLVNASDADISRARSLAWRARSELYTVLPRGLFGFEAQLDHPHGFNVGLHFRTPDRLMVFGNSVSEIDLPAGKVKRQSTDHGERILDISGSDTLLTIRDNAVVLSDLATGDVLHAIPMHREEAGRLNSGRILAELNGAVVMGYDDCLFADFNNASLSSLKPRMTQQESFHCLHAIDGHTVAIASGETIYTLDLRDNICMAYSTEQMYAQNALAMDAVGGKLFFGGVGNVLHVLDLRTKEVRRLALHRDEISSITVLEKERLLVTTGLDGRAMVWDIASEQPLLDLPTSGRMLRASAASADDQRVAIAEVHGRVTVWQRRERRGVIELPHGNSITGVAYDPAVPGRIVSVSFVGETCAALWTCAEGRWSRRDLGLREPFRGVSMSANGDLFVTCSDTPHIRVFSAAGDVVCVFQSEGQFPDEASAASNGADQPGREEPGFVQSVSIAHDARKVAWVSPIGRICIGDIASRQIQTLSPDPGERYSTVCFSPIEDALVAVTTGGTALWINALGRRTRLIDGVSQASTFGRGAPLAFSRDGKELALATGQSGLTVLLVENPDARVSLEGHVDTFKREWTEAVGALAFDPHGLFLASAGSRQSGADHERTIRLWNPRTGELLLRILTDADCLAAAVDPFSDTLCIGSGHRLRLFPFDRELLGNDMSSVKQQMERNLGSSATDLL